MAALVEKLSHKSYRAQLKKQRRKLKRQSIAQARKKENGVKDRSKTSSSDSESSDGAERERFNVLWLQREAAAQVEFQRIKELEKIREEQLRRMKDEIDNLPLKKLHKEATLQEVKSKLPEGPWHNPIAPTNRRDAGQQDICQFFTKTGACRFGDRCSRSHVRPLSSPTLLIRGMFCHFSMEQAMTDDYDADAALEYEESDTYQYFKDFYEDILPEFQTCGRVMNLKVCCNHEPHLRGNVYIQFQTEGEAEKAFRLFNGRYYGGKQLSCQFADISSWKAAICGLFHKNACPKGRNCNFLHVFKNPENDRELTYGSSRSRKDSSVRRSVSPFSRRTRRHRHRSPSRHHKKDHHSKKKKRRRASKHD